MFSILNCNQCFNVITDVNFHYDNWLNIKNIQKYFAVKSREKCISNIRVTLSKKRNTKGVLYFALNPTGTSRPCCSFQPSYPGSLLCFLQNGLFHKHRLSYQLHNDSTNLGEPTPGAGQSWCDKGDPYVDHCWMKHGGGSDFFNAVMSGQLRNLETWQN